MEYATRRGTELATDPAELPYRESGGSPEQQMACRDLLNRLEKAEASLRRASGSGLYQPGDWRAVRRAGQPCDCLGGKGTEAACGRSVERVEAKPVSR